MTPTEPDLQMRMGLINTFASLWVGQALQAGLLTYFALRSFYADTKHERFRAHPANFLSFSGLVALEEHCIVQVCEIIQHEFPDMTGDVPFRRAGELLAHRTAISHPGRTTWTKSWMQRFHDEKREHYDLRAAILWDLQRSMNEFAASGQLAPQNQDILVTNEMGAIFDLMLRCSMRPEKIIEIPPLPELVAQLSKARGLYIEMLERHPDGRATGEEAP